jgi:hypothetical protein
MGADMLPFFRRPFFFCVPDLKPAVFLAFSLWLFTGSHAASAEVIATSATEIAKSPPSVRFQQDRFAIGFWVDPPADEKIQQRYQQIADANFTLVIGGFGATRNRQVQEQLALCRKLGLRAIVDVPHKSTDKLVPDQRALWGYLWYDEPSLAQFPSLARDVAQIRQLRPGKLTFINLLPDYAPATALGTPDYKTYVHQFIDQVQPDVLCMDYYPQFRPEKRKDGRPGYLNCLAVMREESLRGKIPFWNFFNIMPYGPHSDPTEAQLRWQIFSSIAYGAKGVLYFCYYTPEGGEFPKGGAIIGRNDKPTRHYEQARRINAEVKALGPTLMQLTSTRVVHVARPGRGEPATDTSATLAGGPVRRISGDPVPDCIVGEFSLPDGRRAALIQNYDFAYTSWPTVEFDVPADQVLEVSKTTGKAAPIEDDSPAMQGTQVSLDAGDARLFILPAAAESASGS